MPSDQRAVIRIHTTVAKVQSSAKVNIPSAKAGKIGLAKMIEEASNPLRQILMFLVVAFIWSDGSASWEFGLNLVQVSLLRPL